MLATDAKMQKSEPDPKHFCDGQKFGELWLTQREVVFIFNMQQFWTQCAMTLKQKTFMNSHI